MDTVETANYLVTRIAAASIAFPVTSVREIVRAVALTELPGSPAILEGVLNLRGVLVPVIDLRIRLALPPRAMMPEDHLVVLAVGERLIGVRVDEAEDVIERDADALQTPQSVSHALTGSTEMAGLATSVNGALVVYDPDAFLTEAELFLIDAMLAPIL